MNNHNVLFVDKEYNDGNIDVIYDILHGKIEENYGENDGKYENLCGLYYLYVDKDNEKQEIYYLKSVKKNNVDAMNNYAMLLSQTGRHEEAKKYYLIAIEKGNIRSINNYALLLEREGYHKEAEIYYIKAIKSDYLPSFNCYGIFLTKQHKIRQALIYFSLAVKKQDFSALGHYIYLLKYTGQYYETLKYQYLDYKMNYTSVNDCRYTFATHAQHIMHQICNNKQIIDQQNKRILDLTNYRKAISHLGSKYSLI